jgi:hypothetical protein
MSHDDGRDTRLELVFAARRDSDDGRVGRDRWSCLALSLFSE